MTKERPADPILERWRSLEAQLASEGLTRCLNPLDSGMGPRVERGGRPLLNLASNDYLGLASDPRVAEAAHKALDRWGAGAGASRLVCGDLAVHRELEEELCDLKGSEAVLLFSSGYAANLGVIAALAGESDRIFSDQLNHASLIDGIRLSRAACRVFPHRDLEALRSALALEPAGGTEFIVTDAVFSMDGDIAPLAGLAGVARQNGSVLVVDDAHGTGIAGDEGRGTAHHLGVAGEIPVQTATLSKAIGVQGGFVAGSRALVELLVHRCRSFIYSTGLAPVLAGAALASVRLLRKEGWRREVQRGHLARLRSGLAEKGYAVLHEPPAPMLMVLVGEAQDAAALSSLLEARGVLAPAIRPPTVPPGGSRIRLAPVATHTEAEIEQVLDAFPPAKSIRRGMRAATGR